MADTTTTTREPGIFDQAERRRPFGWTAGPDLGLLGLRLALGGIFFLHGCQKLFGMFRGPGIDGFAEYLASLGFRYSTILAYVTGITEVAGGVLVVLGLFTPLAAAGLFGVMINAVYLKWGGGFFLDADGGFEFDAALGAMAGCLVFAGPGRAALDNGRPWFIRPVPWGIICLLLTVGLSAVTLFALR